MNVTLDQISSQRFARTNKVLLRTPLEESTRARNCQISMEQVHDLFQQTECNCIGARKNNLALHEHMHTNHSK